jgi:cytochrome c oxidase assembly protein subunit 11
MTELQLASKRRNGEQARRTLLLKFVVSAAIMFAFGYMLVPLYEQICKIAGLRDLDAPDSVSSTQIDATRFVRLELDANVNRLPWRFQPETPIVEVHPGQMVNLVYEVENTSGRALTGQAVPSYGPALAAEYVKKLECFCFTKQTFGPYEKRRMPVVFVLDPKLPHDVATVTLSYSFFEIEGNGS